MSEAASQRRPSLRRRLLLILLLPMLLLLIVDAVVTYGVALNYSNRVHDADLANDVRTLAQMFRSGEVSSDLPEEARFLIEYEPDGHNYYSVHSSKRGLLGGNGDFAQPPPPPADASPELFYSRLAGRPLRGAALSLRSPTDPSDVLTVTIAETLRDRQHRARQILLLAIPLQTFLILSVLSLVWLGVTRGLRILHPLTRRLALREHELEPITGPDVPVEILPLTRTIDGLFERLRAVLSLQERFIADAAHQLRTPLAGLRLHVDRARGSSDPAVVRDALEHIEQLTQRTARTSTQLLALTRAQSPWKERATTGDVDLARLVPKAVELRIPEALRAGIDLGYQGPDHPAMIHGDAAALQELLDNLIDNILRYAGEGARATVSVLPLPDQGVLLQVEDSGPGVPPEALERLGERFFRVAGTQASGTGLGLAIVQQIAQQHGARLGFGPVAGGGLRISLQFPPPPKS
ncbi:MAG: sensor histidine kinase N-terminal domain-containing protein [Pseudomonadota bacterium]